MEEKNDPLSHFPRYKEVLDFRELIIIQTERDGCPKCVYPNDGTICEKFSPDSRLPVCINYTSFDLN